MGRVAVFGDVGGHREELYAELVRLGADPDTVLLPPDLMIVLAGDLIHRGPDSAGVLALARTLSNRQPAQVVLLAGNHEAQYLHTKVFKWPETLADDDQQLLRSWWRTGRMRAAAAVTAGSGEQFLITHAGLTLPLWRVLGMPESAGDAAGAVNALIPDDDRLWATGRMLDRFPNPYAGPLWAEAGSELYGPWADLTELGRHGLPSSQVHGHSSGFDFRRGVYSRTFPAFLRPVTLVDTARRHVTVRLPGGRMVGIDPCHGTRPAPQWRPLVLPDAVVTAR